MSRFAYIAWPLLIILGLLAPPTPRAGAVDYCGRFVEKLRERGHYDIAVYYLDKMRDSELPNDEFKETIDYEAGLTLLTAARTGRVMGVRQKQLNQAAEHFKRFISEHPNNPLVFSARAQLANLLVERATIQSEQAKEAATEMQRKQFADRARELLDEAAKVFEEQRLMAVEKHEEYPKFIDPSETALIEERAQVRRNILEARLALAGVIYKRAQTHPEDSKQYQEQLQKAADAYGELYQDYSRKMAGLYAQMWEGRCYKEMGKHKHAIELLERLLALENKAEPIRKLQSKALVLYMEACLEADEYRKAIEAAVQWRDNVRGAEETSVEGVAIHYYGAMAGMGYMEQLDQKKPEEAKLHKQARSATRKSLEFVARFRNDFQKRAREALAKLGIEKDGEPETFEDARDAGKDALDRLQAEDIAPEDRRKAIREARDYFRQALALADDETEETDRNIVLYYLTYVNWLGEDYYRTGVIGEHMAEKYPNGVASRQGAKIAMAAYAKILENGSPAENQFEIDRMIDIATKITKLWPDSPDAGDAWMALVRNAVKAKDYAKAREFMQRIPETSPQRGEAELLVGRSLWSQYVMSVRLDEDERPSQAELDALVNEAKAVLESGVDRMKKAVEAGGKISYPLLASTLSLAQIYINQRETEKALALLEDEQVGPLTMIAADHPATEQEAFRTEAFKAGLRAYVGSQQLENAEQIMQQLEDAVTAGGDEEAQARLTRIYISLGRDLEEQLEMLRKQNRRAEQRDVANGFEMFLARILQRPGNTFNSLNWVAETFLGMADGLNPGGDADLPPQAERYYKQAIAAYAKIRKELQADADFGPKGASASIQIRMAKALTQLDQHELAQKLLLLVLRERQMMIDGQIECAYSYQARGEENPLWYKLAILGSRKHEQFWGWGGLGNRLANNEGYRDTFHEARYNLAWCRMKYALAQTGAKKQEWLEKAENDILIVARLFPELGGDKWRPKYDKLLKDIQNLLGKPDIGLEVIEKKPQPGTGPDPDVSARAG